MAQHVLLAVDLGASSGRHVLGRFDGEKLRLEEVYRFDNGPVRVQDSLHWDLLRQWSEVQRGLKAAASQCEDPIQSIGVDTWGVDFGLLGRGDTLLANPHHYRDPRTEGILERAWSVVPREAIFSATGLQFMPFNTLYQLLALKEADSPLLEMAERLLMIPDLFHWFLTGQKTNEFTNATTTQFYNPASGSWSTSLLERFGLPTHLVGEITPPGTDLGPVLDSVSDETGLRGTRVVAPGTHDTASAVMAVPAVGPSGQQPDWCYISSGTWSLMGVEVTKPVINETCAELNFTNEGGVGGTIRLLKNIAGLWLLQECRRIWARQGRDYTWQALIQLVQAASPTALVDPDDGAFLAPRDMPEAIRQYCRETGQEAPQDDGAICRCALDSLAMKYRRVLEWIQQLIGHRIETIHVVGGGSQNGYLCQATANACGRRVLAGPTEATAIGNVMMQAVSTGAVASIEQARAVIAASFDVDVYEPRDVDAWEAAHGRFREVTSRR
jgi:rhamnulokinase